MSPQHKTLRAASTIDEYRLYKAAHEWDLVDPIVIESREDFKSTTRWSDCVEPFNHQVGNLVTFCRRLPVTLLADDVGLGKTISAGLIMSELIARGRLSRTLIVAPKLLGPQWAEELRTKFNISAMVATGRELLDAEPDDEGAVVTTYHSARTYLSRLPADRFEFLVLDEAHKLRNLYGTDAPPQIATTIKKALAARQFKYVLMLTATPIQNRLWDLYSLVDLLTAARGHANPFGPEGMFVRKYVEDGPHPARRLKPEAADEFRSIVYSYMSRVRRGDAKLHFPSREVQLHRVEPTPSELELIEVVGKGIEPLNKLAQIGILQALTSSPHALSAQLENMARKGTIPSAFSRQVREIVSRMPTSAKLIGLTALVKRLKEENPDRWRLVVFTGRRETQTTIQAFLESHGLTVGIINGSTSARNQETIRRFRASPPDLRVIVSTEAGSEGVNLQVANVLVNYDLPWNPMIVEQRIGRVQRLASEHARVGIFNITLRGTFEEYIVGRLMEKLQTAASAIGDIEALLEGAGLDTDGQDGGFEERVRQLVMAALKGADMNQAMRQALTSITEAKSALEQGAKEIDDLLSAGDSQGYIGPRTPTLPKATYSMAAADFVAAALTSLGAVVNRLPSGALRVEQDGHTELVQTSGEAGADASRNFRPGSSSFDKLVQTLIATGLHHVRDSDEDAVKNAEAAARVWVESFGGKVRDCELLGARRWFGGVVLVRARATTAHDSYERLIEVAVRPKQNSEPPEFTLSSLEPVERNVGSIRIAFGVSERQIEVAVEQDAGIAEFSRFYLERRAQEIECAGDDERKRFKLHEEFTPRLSHAIVGAEGAVLRDVKLRVSYRLDGSAIYTDEIVVIPSSKAVLTSPQLEACDLTLKTVPSSCLEQCSVTHIKALRHKLVRSDVSGRWAAPGKTVICEETGKRLIDDEADVSSITGRRLSKQLLKVCAVSHRSAESRCFGRCEFSHADVLDSELRISMISGRKYRADQEDRSEVSGRSGHRSEFVTCSETGQRLATVEAERCEETGRLVRTGVLQACEESHLRVVPSELGKCEASGRRALKRLLVSSSVSGRTMLAKDGVRANSGKLCLPEEAQECAWSQSMAHPDDLLVCRITGLRVHAQHLEARDPKLTPLMQLLDGVAHDQAGVEWWEIAAAKAAVIAGKGDWRIEAGRLAPTGRRIAFVAKVKTLLGLKKRHAGFLYDSASGDIVGRLALGRRYSTGWTVDE